MKLSEAELRVVRAECGDLTDEEFEAFLEYAAKLDLSPMANQIYGQVRVSRGKRRLVFMTGIDGFRLIADRTGDLAGSDDAEFSTEEKRDGTRDMVAKVTVWKMVAGERRPFSASARWSEYAADTRTWQQLPHGMLAKCAEALALRKAFPADLSGLYTTDEMAQAGEAPAVGGASPAGEDDPPKDDPKPPEEPTGDGPAATNAHWAELSDIVNDGQAEHVTLGKLQEVVSTALQCPADEITRDDLVEFGAAVKSKRAKARAEDDGPVGNGGGATTRWGKAMLGELIKGCGVGGVDLAAVPAFLADLELVEADLDRKEHRDKVREVWESEGFRWTNYGELVG